MSLGQDENEKDEYEFAKLKALRNFSKTFYKKTNIFSILENAYAEFFSAQQKNLFLSQKKDKILDRVDLTVLLKSFYQTNESLGTVKNYWEELKNGSLRKKRGLVPFEYSLALVDEFQNYLPEQLELIKSCVSRKSQAILYVGDMAQQVNLGTIKKWEQVGEKISDERKVVLQKVYRNTKNILQYIQSLGYEIDIPAGVKEGREVGEYIYVGSREEIEHIEKFAAENNFSSIGVLTKEEKYLDDFKISFASNEKIHAMTMNEAQGVEFDVVFIVGIKPDTFKVAYENNVSPDLIEEKKRINKDLLYVALTRAIAELHILGQAKLVDII